MGDSESQGKGRAISVVVVAVVVQRCCKAAVVYRKRHWRGTNTLEVVATRGTPGSFTLRFVMTKVHRILL